MNEINKNTNSDNKNNDSDNKNNDSDNKNNDSDNRCWFCKNSFYKINKYPGLGYLCELCIVKIRCLQMY